MKAGSYTGSGLDNRNITGVGFSPGYVIVLGTGAKPAYQRFSAEAGDASLSFAATAEISDRIQSLATDGFQIGTSAEVNAAATTFHYIAWSKTATRVAGGLYLGDGVDNRNITAAGFRPGGVFVKRQDTAQHAYHVIETRGDLTLPTSTAPFANGIQSFLVNGFQVGTDGRTNLASKVYFWSAFRDVATIDLAVTHSVNDSVRTSAAPSPISLASPTTARPRPSMSC
jgi:hypothetical protein